VTGPVCRLCVSCVSSTAEKLVRKTIFEGFVAVVCSKNASPTWGDVKTALRDFDRAGLRCRRQIEKSLLAQIRNFNLAGLM
jgi:hypothetical protein